MTPQKLNSDIKKLYSAITANLTSMTNEQFFEWRDNVAKPEFLRLYGADSNFLYINTKSIRILISLNLTHRFIALHSFGANINVKI